MTRFRQRQEAHLSPESAFLVAYRSEYEHLTRHGMHCKMESVKKRWRRSAAIDHRSLFTAQELRLDISDQRSRSLDSSGRPAT